MKIKHARFGAALAIQLIPNASQNRILRITSDGTIELELTTKSTDPEMNQQLKKFLAEILFVGQDQIEIVAGEKSMKKIVSIYEIKADELQERVLSYLT